MGRNFYSCGKLLLTGEYAVLYGAKAIAIPSKLGQSMLVKKEEGPNIIKWKSKNHEGKIWFEAIFDTESLSIINSNDPEIAERLQKMLQFCKTHTSVITNGCFTIQTTTEFPSEYGLGTSSTLINNLANWANLDPFKILKNSFSGSGFDLAVAQCNAPVKFWLREGNPNWTKEKTQFPFEDKLHFIHLNKKVISRDSIQNSISFSKEDLTRITEISDSILQVESLEVFKYFMEEHEEIIGNAIKKQPIKKELFSDYIGCIKSLGAWGGDFILATGETKFVESYFKKKGYNSIFKYSDLLLNE